MIELLILVVVGGARLKTCAALNQAQMDITSLLAGLDTNSDVSVSAFVEDGIC